MNAFNALLVSELYLLELVERKTPLQMKDW